VLSNEHAITYKIEEAEAGSGKILKETEAFWHNKLERKRTRKQPNLSWAGSGSKKSQEWRSGSKIYSTASISL